VKSKELIFAVANYTIYSIMNIEKTRRRESQWTIVAIVMLAFAVFSWGVQYKLSLYNSEAHMSEAKLLSQKERPTTSEATELAADPLANPMPVPLFTFAFGAMLVALCSLKPVTSHTNDWQQALLPRQLSQNFFFFRPPPFLVSK
jgi:hypothetical protein